ncbi:LruC domain-containing protein [Mucilaginibacter aquatilis]|uniref:LruC domain-containing protein n=1 Tax=Mucilaginibacter aquatilis TaxID=1517760 RepID=A0A6I4IEX4_9SPHI|nr:LruC domain-containing protein [Mucilaginibacter aquatilis]MVN92126.1 LruC domain-containing protein [Mucilaginibacter aquatilis]
MKRNFTPILLAGLVAFSACKKDTLFEETKPATKEEVPIAVTPEIPYVEGFNFKTTKDVKFNLALRTNNDAPLAGVIVSLYLPTDEKREAIFKGVTDKAGNLQGSVTVAASVGSLIIDPAYIGLIRDAEAVISASNTVTATIGGKDGYSGNIVAEQISFSPKATDVRALSYKTSGYQTNGLLATTFAYPGTYTATTAISNTATYPKALGRPVYMEASGDVLDASLLSYINASLPENQPLTATHPGYLNSAVTSTLNVTAKTDVYVTFVSEGAAQKNTLGYYTYPTGTAPSVGASLLPVLGGIDKVTWIFPNASANGSGGGLRPGDKVKLGNFAAGTTIAFIMVKDGWNGSDVAAGNTKFYSNDTYNPGAKKQSILLYDDVHKKFISSFEDIDRTGTTSDNDFNDLVIYSSSSVAGAISTTGVATIDRGGDTDGDGVQDAQDEFPNDAARAYTSYYPSKSTTGTLAFEDQWPSKGDYDMNDLVVSYCYTYEVSATNKVVTLKGDYNVLASGGTFQNGFGIQLPVNATGVSSVTGQKITGSYLNMAANGVEAGQAKAVIIPFDNNHSLVPAGKSANFMNTVPGTAKVVCNPVNVVVNFSAPVDLTSLNVSSLNHFIICDQKRGAEVHLPGYKPTDKANTALFDTGDDATVPVNGKYYVTLENKPFAIMVNGAFSYPVEKIMISKAYLNFNTWATSGGNTHADWYSNVSSGYRYAQGIFTK